MNRLRVLRAEKRVTQFRLRLQTGIHQSKLSLIENGLVSPSEEEKLKISRALGASIGEIFPTQEGKDFQIDGILPEN